MVQDQYAQLDLLTVGVPQLSAIQMQKKAWVKKTMLVADGGIKFLRYIKALVLGNAVMIGSLFAGSKESPEN